MLFLITYDLENVETLAFRWWAAILSNAKRYSKTIISAWQRQETIPWICMIEHPGRMRPSWHMCIFSLLVFMLRKSLGAIRLFHAT